LPTKVCLADRATPGNEVARARSCLHEPLEHELLNDSLHRERARGVFGNQGAGGGESFTRRMSSDELSKALLDRESRSLIRPTAIVSHE
jgi:hypothetical protein